MHDYSGSSTLSVFAMLLSAAVGAIAFCYLAKWVNLSGPLPWGILTVVLLPVGFAMQLLNKLNDARELEGLTRSEERRLRAILDIKVRDSWLIIGFCTLAAVVIAILFWLISTEHGAAQRNLTVVGALIGLMIWSIGSIAAGFKELAKFRGAISSRKQDDKAVRNALSKLRGENKSN